MAIQKNIKINVDTGQATESVKGLGKEIDNTTEKTEEAKGSLGGITGTLDKVTGGAISAFKSMGAGLKNLALGFRSVGFAIAASGIGLLVLVIASLTAAFKGSEEGQNRFAKLMGVIGAITGNVIDLLADFGDFIIDLFSGDGAAMRSLKSFGESIFNVIGLPIKNAIDSVKALGKAFGALFSGDIEGAFEALKNGVSDIKGNFDEAKTSIEGATDALKGFVAQNVEEGKAAAKVADQRAKADIIERNLIVEKAKAEREIADLRLKAKDLNNVSAKEREAALLKVLDIQDDLITKETEVLELRRDAQVAENTFARSNKENLTAEQEAIAAVIAAETRRTDQKRQIQRELTAAENEQRSARESAAKEQQAINAEAQKSEEERLKSISDFKQDLVNKELDLDAKTEEQKLELERSRAELKLENLIGTEEEKREALIALDILFDQKETELAAQREEDRLIKLEQDKKKEQDIINQANDKKLKAEEAVSKAEEAIRQSGFNNARNAFGLFSQLAGESKELQAASLIASNALGIAQNIVSTQSSNAVIVAEGAALAIPSGGASVAAAAKLVLANNISSGISIASSLAATAKGLSALGGGSAGGGGRQSGGRGAAPAAPSFNLVEGTQENQIANSLNNREPVQSFVVATAVTSSQELNRNAESNGSL